MNARRLERYATLLRAERARISALLERMAVAVPAAAELGAPPGQEADAGVSGAGADDDAAIAARELAALREVDEALRLIRESPHDYGICVQCGRPIPEERLELLPATKFCGRSAAS